MQTIRKLRNIKIEIDGIKFDSKKEAKRFHDLKLLERANKITNLRTQVKIEIIPSMKGIQRSIDYVCDFVYDDLDGQTIWEDVKGYKGGATYKIFKMKKKLIKYMYNIDIKEI